MRVAQAALTVLLVSVVVFALARASGDPVAVLLPLDASAEDRARVTHELGLDQPVYQQYVIYLGDLVTGDFGTSLRSGQPVWDVARPALVNSLELAFVAMTIAVAIGIPLGVISARSRRRVSGRLAGVFSLLGQSLPAFWVGIVLILVFGVWLKVLPTAGTGGIDHLILPGFTLGWFVSASIARLLRSEMLDLEGSEFVKLARAKGVRRRQVVWRHMLRNALSPVVTLLGFSFGIVLATAVTTEVVFSWPGLGRLAYQSVLWRDFPLLQFLVMLFAVGMVVASMAADFVYALLDPRIRR